MKKDSLLERWFPHPFVSVIVVLSWLMLSHSVEFGHLLLALYWVFLFHE